jgi:hypothetical protein
LTFVVQNDFPRISSHQLARTYPLYPFYFTSSLSVVFFYLILLSPAYGEEWTSLRGNSTVSAKLIGIWNDRALLRLDDGRQISVKLDDLNANSRIQAQNQQEGIDRVLQERVKELSAIATEASAPAPSTLRAPSPPPAYAPPQDGADLMTELNHLQQQAMSGHLRIYYDSLPKTFQTQADDLVKTLMTKVDPNAWNSYRSASHRLAEIVVTRQRWLMSHPRIQPLDDSSKQSFVTFASMIRQVATEDVLSYDKVTASPLNELLVKLDDVTAPYLAELIRDNSIIASVLFPPYQAESGEGGKMVAKIVVPVLGTIQSVPMTQIDGRWIEGENAEDAQAKWKQYKQMLESLPNGSLRIRGDVDEIIQVLSQHLDSLERATTVNAFHAAIDEMMLKLAPAINRWAGISVQPNYGGFDESMSGDEPFE